jgi:hypothetical protein
VIALSRLLSVGIVLFLVAFFTTSKQADQMSQRWIEQKWLEEHRKWVADGRPMDSPFAPHVLYDQDETERS